MRRPPRPLAAAAAAILLAVALSACETTQEKSARLEKAALSRRRTTQQAATKSLSVTTPSAVLKVISAAVVHGSEGDAAAVTVRNTSGRAQREVPLAITVRDGGGKTLYSNAGPGIAPSLASIAYVPAHGEARWVDDQVQAAGTPASVAAEVGEGQPAPGAPPKLRVSQEAPVEEAGGTQLHGDVTNGGGSEQQELVVDALATRGGKLVAAGRAVLTHLAPAASSSFEVLLVGSSAAGANVQLETQP